MLALIHPAPQHQYRAITKGNFTAGSSEEAFEKWLITHRRSRASQGKSSGDDTREKMARSTPKSIHI